MTFKIVLFLMLGLISCGTERDEDFTLHVDIESFDGYDAENIKVRVFSKSDKYPLPLGEGIARTEDRAIAFALRKMSDDILKRLREARLEKEKSK